MNEFLTFIKTKVLYPIFYFVQFLVNVGKIHIILFLTLFIGSSPVPFITNVIFMEPKWLSYIFGFMNSFLMINIVEKIISFSFNYLFKSFDHMALIRTYFMTTKFDYKRNQDYRNLKPELKNRIKFVYSEKDACGHKTFFYLFDMVHTPAVIIFGISLIIGTIIAAVQSDSFTSLIGRCFIYGSSLTLLIYQIISVVFDFVVTIVQNWKKLHVSDWISFGLIAAIPFSQPTKWVHSIYSYFYKKSETEERKKRTNMVYWIVGGFLLVISFVLTLFYIAGRHMILKTSFDEGSNPTIYVILPYYSFILSLSMLSNLINECVDMREKVDSKGIEMNIEDIPNSDESSENDDTPQNNNENFESSFGDDIKQFFLKKEFDNKYSSHCAFTLVLICMYLFILIVFIVLASSINDYEDNKVNVPNNSFDNLPKANIDSKYIFNEIPMGYHHSNYPDFLEQESNFKYSHVCQLDGFDLNSLEYYCASKLAYDTKINSTENNGKTETSYLNCQHYMKEHGWNTCIGTHKNNLHYAILRHPERNISIIGYRGTAGGADGFHDIQLFIDSAIVPVSLFSFPFYTNDCMDDISYLYSFFGTNAFPRGSAFLANLAKEVFDKYKKQHENDTIIVSGHSLGGALANIVASTKNVNSFTISPPGIHLGGRVYDFKKESSNYHLRSVIPERDIIPNIGKNDGGQVINIPCYQHGFLGCHTLDVSICMTAAMCHNHEFSCTCYQLWKNWGIDCSVWKTNCTVYMGENRKNCEEFYFKEYPYMEECPELK